MWPLINLCWNSDVGMSAVQCSYVTFHKHSRLPSSLEYMGQKFMIFCGSFKFNNKYLLSIFVLTQPVPVVIMTYYRFLFSLAYLWRFSLLWLFIDWCAQPSNLEPSNLPYQSLCLCLESVTMNPSSLCYQLMIYSTKHVSICMHLCLPLRVIDCLSGSEWTSGCALSSCGNVHAIET